LGIRPHGITLHSAGPGAGDGLNVFAGSIAAATFVGDGWHYTVQVRGEKLLVHAPWNARLEGEVVVTIVEEALCVFDAVTGRRLETEEFSRRRL